MVCRQPNEIKEGQMLSPYKLQWNITVNVDGNITRKSICEKLVGVNVDCKLKFNEHLDIF